MARENKTSVPAVISNQEILAEINLISQIQQIETRLAVDPESLRFAQLADAYLGIGDFDHAIALCEKGMQKHPNYDTGTLVLARSYYLSGNKMKAREVLQNFLTTNPASLAGHKLLGDLALEEDDVNGTVSHYRIALRFDPINRQIIQTLVDLKDKYQKLKESKSGDEEEEAEVKSIPKAVIPKPVAEKPAEKIQPEILETAKPKTEAVKEESRLENFIEDAIQPAEDKFAFKEPQPKSAVSESSVISEEVKPVVQQTVASEFSPAYTDEKGVMYFYDDDEVSFDQYKKRLELQKAGKALIIERALLDQKLIEKGVKSAAKESKSEDVFTQMESAFETDTKTGLSEPVAETRPAKEPAQFTSFEDHINESMAREEEELLSEAEQEAALSELEISYKDYLDILTSEDDLLEALFQEETKTGMEEAEDKVSRILKSALGEEAPAPSDTDQPLAYLDYLQSLEDESDIAEASFAEETPLDDGEPIGFGEFSAYLDNADEAIDFETYAVILRAEGVSSDSLWEMKSVAEGPGLKYDEYMASVSELEKAEAAFETIKEAKPSEKPIQQAAAEPVIEEMVTEIKTEERPVAKIEPYEQKPKLTPVAAQVTEEVAEEDIAEEIIEETTEEEINPQEATPELVEKLASRGQFGTAYKVCKMLKVKNPTDAKVDRKILELKRLYVWSSQMVG